MKILIPSLLLTACLLAGCSQPHPPTGAVEAAHAESARPVDVRSAQQYGVSIRRAEPAHIAQTLKLFGVITPDAGATRQLHARYPGVVRRVNGTPGQSVDKGDTLISVESNRSLASYPIRAPIAGVILERNINPGAVVDSGRVLMTVADLDQVWAEFRVFARDIGRVRAGMNAAIQGVYGNVPGEAKLDYVAPVGDVDSQSVVARATLDNRAGHWVPGQFITGNVTVAEVDAAVAVVPQALQRLEGETVVFVVDGDGFVPAPVETGLRSGTFVQITRGLATGAAYAADNSYLIKADHLKAEGGGH